MGRYQPSFVGANSVLLGEALSNTDASSYSLNARSLAGYERIGLCIAWRNSVTLSSATIGGNAAAIGVQHTDSGFGAAIVCANGGGTDTIALTFSGTCDWVHVTAVGLPGVTSNADAGTPGTNDASSGGSIGVSVTPPAGRSVLLAAFSSSQADEVEWSATVIEASDANMINDRASAAHGLAGSTSPVTITVTYASSGNDRVLVAAAYQ